MLYNKNKKKSVKIFMKLVVNINGQITITLTSAKAI